MRRSIAMALAIFAVPFLVLGGVLYAWQLQQHAQQDDERRAIAAGLEAGFPVLERLGVTVFDADQGCEYLVYRRGAYTTEPGSPACTSFDVDGPQHRAPLDATARADIDAIRSAFKIPATGKGFSVELRDGRVQWAQFDIDWCSEFVYEPGYGQLPDADSYEPIAIDDDWYELAC